MPRHRGASDTRLGRTGAGVLMLLLGGLGAACGQASEGSASVPDLRLVADVPLPGSTARTTTRVSRRRIIASTSPISATERSPSWTPGHGRWWATWLASPASTEYWPFPSWDASTPRRRIGTKLATIDAQTLRVTATSPAGDFPDGLAYDPVEHRVFVSDEHGGTDTVIDTDTNQRVATIDLGGDVGNTQYDAASHRVVAAVQGRGQVVVIDPVRNSVVDRYDTPGCDGPHGVLLESGAGVAYVACEGNARLLPWTSGPEGRRQPRPSATHLMFSRTMLPSTSSTSPPRVARSRSSALTA